MLRIVSAVHDARVRERHRFLLLNNESIEENAPIAQLDRASDYET
jgi:hypothetical protein